MKRIWMAASFLLLNAATGNIAAKDATTATDERIPVVDITDLYHPYQDPGDNVDLINAYALPEVDLKAVIFDVTEEYRKPVGQVAGLPKDDQGPREPGFVQVTQLNRIFNKDVPCAAAPFKMMKTVDDKMLDAPAFEQAGIDLLLRVLEETTQPVEIVSFGSARPLAVAYNRNPDLLKSKVRMVHLSAGSSEAGFLEWNTLLDAKGLICVLQSPLPVAIYPCGTKEGAFAYGAGNTFWRLPDRSFVNRLAPPLRRYCAYTFERMTRSDYLRALADEQPAEMTSTTLTPGHNVWETAAWLNVARRRIVRHANGRYEIVSQRQILPTDEVLPNELKPCTVEAKESGEYLMHPAKAAGTKWMYDRGDPRKNEAALLEAFPAWLASISP